MRTECVFCARSRCPKARHLGHPFTLRGGARRYLTCARRHMTIGGVKPSERATLSILSKSRLTVAPAFCVTRLRWGIEVVRTVKKPSSARSFWVSTEVRMREILSR